MAIATLTVDVVAKLASLERDMGRAAHVAERNAAKMDAAFKKVSGAIGAIAGAVSAGALAQWVTGFGQAAKEIDTLSAVSGAGAEQFQRLAYGAKSVGIEQEKLADIFKDTQDKVGEFLQTGGGPLKDFFEQVAPQVGVTVDQFARLSGPEALQLYFDSLQKANLGQKEMTFYLEAIASDSSRLAPLLRDNGEAWREMGDEAERFGAVLSGDAIKAGVELNKQIDQLNASLRGMSDTLLARVVPSLNKTIENFNTARRAGLGFFESLTGLGVRGLNESVDDARNNAGKRLVELRAEISELEADRDRQLSFGSTSGAASIQTAIDQLQKLVTYYKELQRQQALTNAGDNFGNEGRGQGAGASLPGAGGKPAKPSKPQKKDKEFDALAESAKAYERAIQSISAAEIAADKSTRDLSAAQSALYDVMRSPEWEKMPESWRKTIIAQADAATQAERAAAMQKRVNEVLAQTPTAELKRSQELMQALAAMFHSGALNAEQFSEAAQTALGSIPEKAQEATDAMTVFAEQAARNMQDIFADYLFDGFSNGLDGMLKDFGVMLQRMIAQAVAADLAKRLMGAAGGSDWGSAFASIFGGGKATGGPVAAGTTYLVGERGPELVTMPRDGFVTPNHALRGPTNNISINITGSQNAGEVRRAAGQGARQALALLSGAARYQ